MKGLQTNNLNRYSTHLVSGVLRKIQFRYDPELKELDNETVDDDVSIAIIRYPLASSNSVIL